MNNGLRHAIQRHEISCVVDIDIYFTSVAYEHRVTTCYPPSKNCVCSQYLILHLQQENDVLRHVIHRYEISDIDKIELLFYAYICAKDECFEGQCQLVESLNIRNLTKYKYEKQNLNFYRILPILFGAFNKVVC